MAALQLGRVVKKNENPLLLKPCYFENRYRALRWDREAPPAVFHCSVLLSVKTTGLLENKCNQPPTV